MNKTVCDICGSESNVMSCTPPVWKEFDIFCLGERVGSNRKLSVRLIDLCEEHAVVLADIIEIMKNDAKYYSK